MPGGDFPPARARRARGFLAIQDGAIRALTDRQADGRGGAHREGGRWVQPLPQVHARHGVAEQEPRDRRPDHPRQWRARQDPGLARAARSARRTADPDPPGQGGPGVQAFCGLPVHGGTGGLGLQTERGLAQERDGQAGRERAIGARSRPATAPRWIGCSGSSARSRPAASGQPGTCSSTFATPFCASTRRAYDGCWRRTSPTTMPAG